MLKDVIKRILAKLGLIDKLDEVSMEELNQAIINKQYQQRDLKKKMDQLSEEIKSLKEEGRREREYYRQRMIAKQIVTLEKQVQSVFARYNYTIEEVWQYNELKLVIEEEEFYMNGGLLRKLINDPARLQQWLRDKKRVKEDAREKLAESHDVFVAVSEEEMPNEVIDGIGSREEEIMAELTGAQGADDVAMPSKREAEDKIKQSD